MEFAVVKFVQNNDVDVVPCSWLYEDKVYWPPQNIAPKILPHRRERISPAEYWDLYPVYTLGIFETWEDAERKLKIAQVRSDLDSTDPDELGRGKRVQNKRLVADLSSDDSDYMVADDIIPETPKFIHKRKSNIENKRPLIEKLFTAEINGDKTNAESSPTLSRYAATQSGGKIDEDSFTLSTLSNLCGIPELNRQPSSQSLLLNKSCGNRGGKIDEDSFTLSTSPDLCGISEVNRQPSSQSLLLNKSCGNRELSLDGKQPPALASSSILSNKDVEGYLKAILRNVISIKNRIKKFGRPQHSSRGKN
ncbi:uncharacterized protein LOC129226536 [Uloborus diversus]|uniref:uncharacterized protein LOC129226536 n=1 Tax=Uloborus diversus TaxID=327109 RepID=UPI0024091211|nr:uncharacterized protein LOC129226536 [Uloborus diversus]XP_054717121.1 uncharacterized protein LOC129226536 [Uloborus diversus]